MNGRVAPMEEHCCCISDVKGKKEGEKTYNEVVFNVCQICLIFEKKILKKGN